MNDRKPKDPCPKCEGPVKTVWSSHRMLEDQCKDSGSNYCSWVGDPYIPPTIPISAIKEIGYYGSWHYEIFDQYGHCAVSSQGFNTETECKVAAQKDLPKYNSYEGYGKCTAIIWPATVKVEGEILK